MRSYLILIVMDDGSSGQLRGDFRSDCEAIMAALHLDGVKSVFPHREAC